MNLLALLRDQDQSQFEIERDWFELECERLSLSLGAGYFEVLFATAVWLKQKLAANAEALKKQALKKEVFKKEASDIKRQGKFTLGISGGQGSGKSTFAALLASLLGRSFSIKTLVLSLDDFYLSRADRDILGSSVHPLLKTRGVPGTHDIPLLRSVLDDLKHNRECQLPIFDKAEDDRVKMQTLSSPEAYELVIIEGWCWGSPSLAPDDLNEAINSLEREEDADGQWRRYINERLIDYQALFANDATIFIAVPDMASVFDWRWQQEQRLTRGTQKMDHGQLSAFIMRYERITRWMLRKMPDLADLSLWLDAKHAFTKAQLRQHS